MANIAFTLSSAPQTLPGTWFIVTSKLSQSGKHLKTKLFAATGPFANTSNCIDVLMPPDTPPLVTGGEIDDPVVEAAMVGRDEDQQPTFAAPSPYIQEPDGPTPRRKGDDGTRVSHSCVLVGHSGFRLPGQTSKIARSVELVQGLIGGATKAATAPTAAEAELG